jgi:GH24 family phage-related lysozyme (muramidase)
MNIPFCCYVSLLSTLTIVSVAVDGRFAVRKARSSSDDNTKSVLAWLKIREGFKSTGYIPTAGSGVTIGIGIDLGQQTEARLRSLGISSTIIAKLKPYLGYDTRARVERAGLRPSDLKLTDAEATALSLPFVKKEAAVAAAYGTRMNQNGRDTLASLRHWAGALGNSRVQAGGGKLAVKTTKGRVRNFVWKTIRNKRGTTAQLKNALKNTLKYHRRGTAAYNRIRAEIRHL